MYNFSDIYKNFPSLGARNVLWSFNSSPISLSAKYTLHYTYNTPEHRNNAFLALYFGVRISNLPSKYSKTSSTTWWVWEYAFAHLSNKLGIRMCTMCLMLSTWKVRSEKTANSKCCRDDAMLSSAYPVHGSASEVNRSGADAQVVSCHRYLVFCWAVNRLPYTWTLSGVVFYPRPQSPSRWHHERYVPKKHVNYAQTCKFQS